MSVRKKKLIRAAVILLIDEIVEVKRENKSIWDLALLFGRE